MNINKQFLRTLFEHLILSILFIWYFVPNSFLRPAVELGTECFLASLIVIAAEVNFWILYPSFQKNNHLFLYFALSAGEIIVLSVVEYCLTIDANMSMYVTELANAEYFQIQKALFLNLLFRNCGLFSVVMILAYNTDLRIRLFEKDRKLFKLNKQLIVQSLNDKHTCLLDADRICYVQQNQNYNNFYTFEGALFNRRSTLMDIQELLGEENFLKISKSVIVSKSHIKDFTEDKIVLLTDNNIENYQLTIGKTYLSEVSPIIKSLLYKAKQDLQESESSKPEPPQPEPTLPELHPKALAIFQYISTFPGCKITDIMEGTKIPKSTVTRYLKDLLVDGLIEYVGSKKTGGYRAMEKKVNRNT